MDPVVIWADGDAWRDLTEEVQSLAAVTVVSRRGTTRLIDLDRRRHTRLPLEGGHVLPGDASWMPLGSLAVTPCGVVVEHSSNWLRGTHLRLVLAGLVPDWAETEVGRRTLDTILGGRKPTSPGHPDRPCGAYYCTMLGGRASRTDRIRDRADDHATGS